MLKLYDTARRPVLLDQQLARGGQGVVYAVSGQPALLGKIYVPMPGEGQEEKLRWMLAHPPPDPSAPDHASIAWPRDLLFDASGHFLGYLMPYVQEAWPILRVFNPRSREGTLPGFSRRYLYRAALNLARSLQSLHEHDYIVGDLNESNVLVTRRAMITLIDTDSFQVQEPKQGRIIVYPCPVGKPEYTAPELQGQAFRDLLRHWEHDAFALAVLVFQLLLEGNHPYRARWLGAGDPLPLAERIQRGLYPHGGQRSAGDLVAPAPGVPRLDTLAPDVVDLFRRCFVEGHAQPGRRPTAGEWAEVLAQTEQAFGRSQAARPATAATRPAPATTRQNPAPRTPRATRQRQMPPAGTTIPAMGKQGLAQLLQSWAQGRQTTTTRDAWLRMLAQASAFMLGSTGQSPSQAPTPSPSPAPAATQRPVPPAAAPAGAATAVKSAPKTVACMRCGHANHADEIYCQRCANPLAGERPCPRCQKSMPSNSHYCTHCSSRV